jgi:DNA-binding NtrC family response regulator
MKKLPTVVLIEDDPLVLRVLATQLRMSQFEIVEASSGRAGLAAVNESTAVVCLDLGLGDMPGLEVLNRLGEQYPDLPVIVVTASDRAEDAVSSIQSGAYDYLVKPVEEFRLKSTVERAIERHRLVRKLLDQNEDNRHFGNMIGDSAAMRQLATQVDRVLTSDVSVAIFGESGTGKELVAKTLHDRGTRRSGPFVALNCAAIPENLLESELFGHEKGAFTGAQTQHRGRFEQADGGTLFLDEIGEMSAATQASLLRTLQEGTIRRVGGVREIQVNTRVVCATHRDLAKEVEEGRFRGDLYYRLVVYPIQIPALRDRADDIPLLVAHFLKNLAKETGSKVQNVDADALEALVAFPWPGNVRELQNIIHRAVLSCDSRTISVEHLPKSFSAPKTKSTFIAEGEPAPAAAELPLLPLAELEQRAIRNALAHTQGSVGKAAKLLGIGRATLYRRLSSDSTLLNQAVRSHA